jgi:L-rhamnose mutarotase
MPTFAMVLDLIDDPEVIAAYEAHHRAVWPEVLAALRRTGLEDMRIFRSGHHLFMVMTGPEGFDPATAFRDYADTPAVQRWDELMRGFQRKVPHAGPGDWWTPIPCVFDLAQPGPADSRRAPR